jgi:hypothetical protein
MVTEFNKKKTVIKDYFSEWKSEQFYKLHYHFTTLQATVTKMEADGVFLTEKDSVQFEKVIGELNELL